MTFDYLVLVIGQVLSQEFDNANNQSGSVAKQVTFDYLINNENFLNKLSELEYSEGLKEFKDYPKIIMSALCDKNKEARASA